MMRPLVRVVPSSAIVISGRLMMLTLASLSHPMGVASSQV